MPAVEIADLTVRYGDLVAVDGLSVTAEAGQVVCLLGPNGAGKTSTVETAEGYRRPTGGTVSVLGLDPVDDRGKLSQRVGVMLQGGGVYPGIRVIEAIRLFASYYHRPVDEPEHLLEVVGLADRSRATWRHLSGGEQQRLSLALALVGRPEVAFLDEPTAGVDVGGRNQIRSLITGLRDDGVCVVLATHDLDEAERLADRVVIIDRGTLVAAGEPAELTAAAQRDEIRFTAPVGLDVADLGGTLACTVEETSPGEYLAATAPSPAAVAALTAWLADHDLPLGDLRAGRQRLEDVFLRLTDDTPSGPSS